MGGVAKFWRKSIPSSSWFISKAADGCALQAMLQSPHLPSLPSSIGKMSGGRHRFFLGGIWGEPTDRMAKSLARWGVAGFQESRREKDGGPLSEWCKALASWRPHADLTGGLSTVIDRCSGMRLWR